EQELVCPRRDDDFFYQQFEDVGERLQQASIAHPIRPDSYLTLPDDLALGKGEIGHRENDRHRNREDFRQRPRRGDGICPDQPFEVGQVHALTFCCAATRSSSISPNKAPSPLVSAQAAGMRAQFAGSLSSRRKGNSAWPPC